MRTLYFDCFAGASGDMILGAMIGAGVDPLALKSQLSLFPVDECQISFESVNRAGIGATYARVTAPREDRHRHLADILGIIAATDLKEGIKDRAAVIFQRLAQAEAQVHNTTIEKVHFHEVGALDAIIDIVGSTICFDLLGIDRFVCSPLHVGSGTVEMEHGKFSVPPPAVVELLKGMPIYSSDIKGELVTPTGAAIIATVCERFGPIPLMKVEQTGYGAGSRTYEKFPNVLRVLIGEELAAEPGSESLWMIETNLDDMSPQIFGHVIERALALGALDCYLTPIQMKKNRPGVLLSILCCLGDRDRLEEMIFLETTTLGVRGYGVTRRALEREIVSVNTPYGSIDVKVARLNGRVVNEMPEFEQCRAAALKFNVSLRVVEDSVRATLAKIGTQ